MKSLKSRGGLTHGSGMAESVRTMWINSMHKCASVHQVMTKVTKLDDETEVKHSEMRKSRIVRDGKDMRKILDWFRQHDPFQGGR